MLKTLWSLLIGLLGISIMILIHELGHFLAAKVFKVDVEVVSFGFGPPILKWGRYRTYQIGILPFGGYCKMKGESDLKRALAKKEKYVESTEEGSLYSVSPFKRLLLYFNGPFFNILFAIFCFFILLILPVQVPCSEPRIVVAAEYPLSFPAANDNALEIGLRTGALITSIDGIEVSSYQMLEELLRQKNRDTVTLVSDSVEYKLTPVDGLFGLSEFVRSQVASVKENSPEQAAGLRHDDLILSINGKPITNMFDILTIRKENPDSFDMVIKRKDKTQSLSYKPSRDVNGNIILGFTLVEDGKLVRSMPLNEAFILALDKTFSVFSTGISAIGDIFKGRNSVHDTVAGTLGASTSIGELTTKGFNENFSKGLRIALYLMAGVSTSIAIANLLPIPSLDGGLILLSFVEMIKGKNASAKVYIVCQICGLLLVLALMVVLNFVK